jgi:hypothetical protein
MIDPKRHNFVVIIDDEVFLGFPHYYSAVALLDRQIPVAEISAAMISLHENGELTIDKHNFKLMTVEDWEETYFSEESSESDDEI